MTAITGDDAAIAVLGLGADLDGFKQLFKDRTDEIGHRYIDLLDELDGQVHQAEQQLAGLRARRVELGAELWGPTRAATSATRPCPEPAGEEGTVKAGDVINGYRILEDFRVVGAGPSKVDLRRQGRPGVLPQGVPQPHLARRARPGQRPDQDAQAPALSGLRAPPPAHQRGPDLRRRRQPDRHPGLLPLGAKYYKVTEKVEVAGLSPADVAALPFPDQLVLLKTVAHSLRIRMTAASSTATSSPATSSSSEPSSGTRPS